MMKIILKKKSIPHLYDNTYTDTVEEHMLVYNPLSTKGLSVLNKEAAYLFNYIDSKKSLDDIYLLVKKQEPTVTFANIKVAFLSFLSSDLIYFEKKINPFLLPNPFLKVFEVWFHITNECNLRCKYCYVKKTPDHMNDELAKKAIGKIIHDAAKHNFDKVMIKFSGGECLLEFPRLIRLVDFGRKMAKQQGIDIGYSILTNGVLITNKVAEIIKKKKIEIGVSIDGFEKEHDKQRVFMNKLGSFKYVEKGIKNLQKNKVRFHVMTTITSLNVKKIPSYIEYLLENNIRFVFNLYHENENAEDGLNVDNATLIKYLSKTCDVIYNNVPKENIISNFFEGVSFVLPHIHACGVGSDYLVVRHDGKLALCATDIDNIVGSINDEDIIHSVIKGFSKRKRSTVENMPVCRTCQWKYICCGGCPLSSQTSSIYCSLYMAIIPKLLKIEAKRMILYPKKP